MKKIFICLCLIICQMYVAHAARGQITVEPAVIDLDDGTVTITGAVSDKASDQIITIQLIYPGEDTTDPEFDLNEVLGHVGDFVTGEQGSFGYTFYMPKAAPTALGDDYYLIKLYGNNYELATLQFEYVNKELALAEINSVKQESEMKTLIEAYGAVFNLDMELYNNPSLITDSNKLEIAGIICQKSPFATISELRKEFIDAGILAALRNADSVQLFKEVLNSYYESMQVDLENVIYTDILTEEQRDAIIDKLYFQRKTYNNFDSIKTDFREEVLNTAITGIENKDTISDIIDEFEDLIIEADSSMAAVLVTYKGLTYTNKVTVNTEILKQKPTGKVSFAQAIKSAVASLNRPTPTPPSGGSTSGGGGGRISGGGAIAVQPTQTPVATPTPTETPIVTPTAEPGQPTMFTDIDSVSWAKESIEALASKKIIEGYNNEFHPNNNITREEFIKIIVGAFELLDESASCQYTDIDSGHWAYTSISSAVSAGIINGIEPNIFGLGSEISRQDMAVIAERISQKRDITLPQNAQAVEFTDDDSISDYAKSAVSRLQMSGIINGFDDGSFRPQDKVTRAQAAKVVYLLLEL